MGMLKVLIADGMEDFRLALADALREQYEVRTCRNGEEALKLARTFAPDLLVLDFTLEEMDGLSLIQNMLELSFKPIILATTCFLSDYALKTASRLGVGYLMLKPCSIKSVVSRLTDMASLLKQSELARPDPRVMVANLLLALGVATNRKGYQCLREAIPIYSRDPNQSITKELYPAVAEMCNGDPCQVERAMRSAIEKAWEERDDQIWRLYFTPKTDGTIRKPTNSEFISRLADCLMANREI